MFINVITIFKDETKKLFINLIDLSQNKRNFFQTINNIRILIQSHPNLFKLSEVEIFSFLKKITLNGFILDENANQSLSQLYKTLKSKINEDLFKKNLEEFTEKIQNFDSNFKDEEQELIKNNQSHILSLLAAYKIN